MDDDTYVLLRLRLPSLCVRLIRRFATRDNHFKALHDEYRRRVCYDDEVGVLYIHCTYRIGHANWRTLTKEGGRIYNFHCWRPVARLPARYV